MDGVETLKAIQSMKPDKTVQVLSAFAEEKQM